MRFSAAIVGSTGLVGNKIIKTLLAGKHANSVVAFARRSLLVENDSHQALSTFIESDSTKWPNQFASLQSTPDVFFSALGTTRGKAGGIENQRKIDFDLNLELARAARKAGVEICVLISTAGASTTGLTAYQRMKAELDEAIADLGFNNLVILRPGFLLGDRPEATTGERFGQLVANTLGKCSRGRLSEGWSQQADLVALAAVKLAVKCVEGTAPPGKVWIVNIAEIIELGKSG